jgi:hypothetical protein
MGVKLLREYVRQVLLEKKQPFDMVTFRKLSGEAAEEYLDFHAKTVGAGVGRTAYDVGDGSVIKWAINKGGVKANKREAMMVKCASPGAPVVPVRDAAPGHAWILVDKVQHILGKKLDRATKMVTGLASMEDLMYAIADGIERFDPKQGTSPDYSDQSEVHQRLYKTNEWYRALFDTVKACKLNPYELHGDNWGLDENGDLVLLDAGS